jgi:hypothetical protein
VKKWFVSEPSSNEEVPATRGKSKTEAQECFMKRQKGMTGEEKPWVWWEKQGYRVRKG